MNFNNIVREHPFLCDGGDPTALVNVIMKPPTMPFVSNWDFLTQDAIMENRSGSTAHLGLGVRFRKEYWTAGQVAPSGAYTDGTVAAQNATASDFALETTVNNSGFAVFSPEQFNLVCLLVGTANGGGDGGAVRKIQYSAAGAWKDMASAAQLVASPQGIIATGELLAVWFDMPPDWTVTTGAEATGVPIGVFGIQCLSTTAPGTAALATSLTVHRMGQYKRSVANGSSLVQNPSDQGILLGHGEALTAAFSVKHDDNRVECRARARA